MPQTIWREPTDLESSNVFEIVRRVDFVDPATKMSMTRVSMFREGDTRTRITKEVSASDHQPLSDWELIVVSDGDMRKAKRVNEVLFVDAS